MEEQAQRSMEMLAHTATVQMLGRSRPDLSRKAPAQTTTIFSREIRPKSNRRAAECGFHILSQESSTCFCFWGLLEKCSSPARNGVWLGWNTRVSSSRVALGSAGTPRAGKAQPTALAGCCRLGCWERGQQSHGGPKRPPSLRGQPIFLPSRWSCRRSLRSLPKVKVRAPHHL